MQPFYPSPDDSGRKPAPFDESTMAPEELRVENAIRNRFRMFRFSESFRYCYVNLPKCACSTIKRTLWQHETTEFRNADLHRVSASPFSFCPRLRPDQYFFFTFVRNPVDRLISFYMDKIVRKTDEVYLNFCAVYGLRDRKYSLEETVDILGDVGPLEMDPHWAPQTTIMNLQNVRYDLIGRLETFRDDWNRLQKKIGLPSANIIKHAPHARNVSADCGKHLNDRVLAKTLEVYKQDFDALGYLPDGRFDDRSLDGMGRRNDEFFLTLGKAVTRPRFAKQWATETLRHDNAGP